MSWVRFSLRQIKYFISSLVSRQSTALSSATMTPEENEGRSVLTLGSRCLPCHMLHVQLNLKKKIFYYLFFVLLRVVPSTVARKNGAPNITVSTLCILLLPGPLSSIFSYFGPHSFYIVMHLLLYYYQFTVFFYSVFVDITNDITFSSWVSLI